MSEPVTPRMERWKALSDSATARPPGAGTTGRVLGLSALLAASAAALCGGLLAGEPSISAHRALPSWVLIPAFALTFSYPVSFELRGQARLVTLCQLPLGLAFVFVAPVGLVLAKVSGVAIGSFVIRRQSAVKTCYNGAVAALESTLAVLAFRAIYATDSTGFPTGAAVLTGGVVAEIVGAAAVAAVIALISRQWDWRETLRALRLSLIAVTVLSSLALVAIAGMRSDPNTAWALVVVGALVVGMVHAYSRLAEDNTRLARLYRFTRGLGPIDPEGDLTSALDELRELLYAERLELTLVDPADTRARVITVGGNAPAVATSLTASAALDLVEREVLSSGRPSLQGRPRWRMWDSGRAGLVDGGMAAPVTGDARLLGVLRAQHRSGEVRGFDNGDLRVLETVAGQLGTALEKGRLLTGLKRAATRDSLTGLANLDSTRDSITSMLADSRGAVVLMLDIDRFQDINDMLGHHAGDDVLREVARRLRLAVPPGAVCGRVGGDQFAVALAGAAGAEVARMAALGVKARVEGPVQAGSLSADVRVTVGVTRAPEHGDDVPTLVRRAEMAMYAAKEGSARVLEWEPSLERDGSRRLTVVARLRDTLHSDGLHYAFQPKIALDGVRTVGCEALVRWKDQEIGSVSPDEFVPLAETSGLIGPLTTAVLAGALDACRDWQRRGAAIGVSVNLSARSLLDPLLVGQVSGLLNRSGLAPSWLTLELTESSVMANPIGSVEVLRQLRALGVRLSIDDFGTGYSSLTYVKGLPVHEVKIDRSFVAGVEHDRADRAVVRAVVELAHSLGLTVVAEGVETLGQVIALASLDVDEVQGFHYGRPMELPLTNRWLQASGMFISDDPARQ